MQLDTGSIAVQIPPLISPSQSLCLSTFLVKSNLPHKCKFKAMAKLTGHKPIKGINSIFESDADSEMNPTQSTPGSHSDDLLAEETASCCAHSQAPHSVSSHTQPVHPPDWIPEDQCMCSLVEELCKAHCLIKSTTTNLANSHTCCKMRWLPLSTRPGPWLLLTRHSSLL